MIKTSLLLLICPGLIACAESQPNIETTQSITVQVPEPEPEETPEKSLTSYNIISKDTLKSYSSRKNTVASEKTRLLEMYDAGKINLDSVGKCFEELLLNGIIPHWYGTVWSFYGHTDTPGTGEIACGYFVSTTLKHMGINVNRYRLAQQTGYSEAKSLYPGKLHVFRNMEVAKITEEIKNSLPEGIYFVGLDNHVGYVLHRKGEVFFLHSNYIASEGVVIEKAEESVAFGYSNYYCLAPVSGNNELMRKWLTGEVVKVVLD